MTQPAFWLRITSAYVIENFEELLKYVAAYHVAPSEPAYSDFMRTADHLSDVARELLEKSMETSFELTPDWNMPNSKAIRIIATAIFTEFKRNVTPHDLIAGLIRVLLQTSNVSSDHMRAYTIALINCARKIELVDTPFYLSDLDASTFSESVICTRLAFLGWDRTQKSSNAYFEGAGTFIFSPDGIDFTPMNHDDCQLTVKKRRKILEVTPLIKISDINSSRLTKQNIDDMFDWWPSLMRDQRNVKPSRVQTKRHYNTDDSLDVKITYVSGRLVQCESVDPEYEKLSGKILLHDPNNLGVSRASLQRFLKKGDILPAKFIDGPEFTFEIDESEEEDFKIDVIANSESMKAVFESDFATGSRWQTECGLVVNIPDSDEHDIDAFRRPGACIGVKLLEARKDRSGNIVCNGEPLPASEQSFPDIIDPYAFRQEAKDNLAQSLLAFLKSNYSDDSEEDELADDLLAERIMVSTLGMLLLNYANKDTEQSSPDRLGCIIAAAAAFECANCPTDVMIARREIGYQAALAAFSTGENPAALKFDVAPEIKTYQRSIHEAHVIGILRKYKDEHHSIRTADSLRGDQTRMIEQLVEASNTLRGKIEGAEISRIKKTIATKLHVVDLFRDTCTDYKFYGFENDTMEFKVSCCRPPLNRQSGSEDEDIRFQNFVILKTICAFLNSPSGGDLLLGVNDEGYAVGVRSDIDYLFNARLIAEPNIDRLRIYLRNIIDRAFVSNDNLSSGSAITAQNIKVNIEESRENLYIIRIKTNAYPYDVVRIRKEFVPSGQKNVYYRTTGTSQPLDTAGIRNVRLAKIGALDANESKTASILSAIDNKKQLRIHDYHSRSGLTTLRIEPHALLLDNTALQAYDVAMKQMRLLRIARIERIEVLPSNWEFERKHKSLPVDIFGSMQSDKFRGEQRKAKLNHFALSLLYDEFPESRNSEAALITENKGADRDRYPWILETTVYDPFGFERFTRGLPDDTAIIE